MRRRAAVFWTLLWAVAAGRAGPASGLSLRSPVKEIVVEGLDPGGRYSLHELTGMGLVLENAGPEPVELALGEAAASSDRLKDGYEPAARWLTVANPRRRLAGGEAAFSDAWLAIPPDKGLRGGRYEIRWAGTARDAEGRTLTLASRLLLHIGPQPAKPDKDSGPPAGWALAAREGRAEEVPLGRRVGLRELGVRLKVSNLGEQTLRLRVRSAESPPDAGPPAEGWEAAPNPNFLEPQAETLEVEPGRLGEARLFLRIPDQERYRARRWVFTVSVDDGKHAALYRVLASTPARRGRKAAGR